jgi:hypothetical protein
MAREQEREQERERAKPNGESQQLEHVEASKRSDVVLDVPSVSVDEINLNVEQLSARVSMDTAVAEKLVRIRAGVDVDLSKVDLQIKGVQAEAHLRVKLDTVARIVEEALTTLRESPALVQAMVGPVERTAGWLAEGPLSSAAQSLAEVSEGAKDVLEDVDVTGRARKVAETSKVAARKVKHGFSRAVSALPNLRRRRDSEGDEADDQGNGSAHARTDAETGVPPGMG